MPRAGAVVRGNTASLPWRLVDGSGVDVEHVNLWLAELYACDSSPATLRAYAYDLLGWTRFLGTIEMLTCRRRLITHPCRRTFLHHRRRHYPTSASASGRVGESTSADASN